MSGYDYMTRQSTTEDGPTVIPQREERDPTLEEHDTRGNGAVHDDLLGCSDDACRDAVLEDALTSGQGGGLDDGSVLAAAAAETESEDDFDIYAFLDEQEALEVEAPAPPASTGPATVSDPGAVAAHGTASSVGADIPHRGSHDDRTGITSDRSTQLGANLDGQVTAGQTWSQERDGRSLRSTSVSGTADLDWNNGRPDLAEVGGDGRVTRGNAVATGGLRIRDRERMTRRPDGRYEVQLQSGFQGTAGGGAQSNGGRVGGTVTGRADDQNQEVRIFDSEEEARRHMASGGLGRMPTAEEALELERGESNTQERQRSLGAGVTGNTGIVTLGASGQNTQGQRMRVQAQGGGRVRVEVQDSDTDAGSLTAGAGMVANVAAGNSTRTDDVQEVEFDLNTAAGREAYEEMVRTGEVPEGARLTQDIRRVTEEDSMGGSAFGLGVNNVDTRSRSTGTVNGVEQVEESGRSGVAVTAGALGQYQESQGLHMVTRGDETSYIVTGQVSAGSDQGRDVMSGLADLTGTTDHAHADEELRASGTWNVSYRLSESQVDGFADQVESGELDPASLMYQNQDGHDLRTALQRAESPEERRAAMADFFAETGSSGVEWMRTTLDEDPEIDLALSGDQHLGGESGRLASEQRVDQLMTRMESGEDPREVLEGAHDLRSRLVARRDALNDDSRYQDLPRELRAEELRRTEEMLAEVEDVRTAALEEREDPLATAIDEGGECAGELERGRATYDQLRGNLESVREGAMASRGEASSAYDVQERGHGVSGLTAREQLGGSGILGTSLGQGEERERYEAIDGHRRRGQGHWQAAEEARRQYEAVQARIETSSTTDASELEAMVEEANRHLQRSVDAYRLANFEYRRADDTYERIQADHSQRGGMFGR